MSLIRCSECDATISENATSCPRCGNPHIGKEPQLEEPAKLFVPGWVSLIVIAFAIAGFQQCAAWRQNSTPTVASAPQATPAPVRKLLPSERLVEAKKALGEAKSHKDPAKRTYGRVDDAWNHLTAIPKDAKEYPEAQKLKKEVQRRRAEINRKAEAVAAQMMISQRENISEKLDTVFLNMGLDVKIKLSGKNKTNITMSNPLLGRVMVHRLTNETELLTLLRNAGFKRANFKTFEDSEYIYFDL